MLGFDSGGGGKRVGTFSALDVNPVVGVGIDTTGAFAVCLETAGLVDFVFIYGVELSEFLGLSAFICLCLLVLTGLQEADIVSS